MKVTSVLLYSVVLGFAYASPVYQRDGVTDADILNYALTLEHLEAVFYEEGLKNYTQADFVNAGMKDPFYANLKMVGTDEQTHEQFLTQALTAAGAQPVARCNYSFPSTDVKSFLALASVLEGVGVSAYLGAAASIMNDTYLTAAGSILTVEARHSAYLRAALGEAPSAQAFDNPLDLNEVYTVASPFIVSCPSSNQQLPVKAFPSLVLESTLPAMTGSSVQLMTGSDLKIGNTTDIYAAFITVTGPVWTPITSNGNGNFTVTIPKGIAGQSYVVLTQGNSQATDDNIVAGPAIIEISTSVSGMTTPTVSFSMGSGMISTSGSVAGSSSTTSVTATGSATASPTPNGAPGTAFKSLTGVAVSLLGVIGLLI
ncbi:hypothetical protein N7540_011231 [Penicillium herquei]|nr:hypothetical protein N7540_011231 [Penicillium herquei]